MRATQVCLFLHKGNVEWQAARNLPGQSRIFTSVPESRFGGNLSRIVNFYLFLHFAFALAGTSTEVERVFSLIKQIWSDQRSRLDLKTVDALLSIQFNSEMTCREFYETIKKDSIFLDKAHSNNKYDN